MSEVLYANYFVKLIDIRKAYKLEVSEIDESIRDFGVNGNIESITKYEAVIELKYLSKEKAKTADYDKLVEQANEKIYRR